MVARGPRRIGVIADVHANRQALVAGLAWLEEAGVEAIVCLGDVVGYGGDPGGCLDAVRERCAVTIRGNHDHAAVDPAQLRWFNAQARAAIEIQAATLSPTHTTWLAGLPATAAFAGLRLGHGGFADPEAYPYVVSEREAAPEFGAFGEPCGWIGHTHVPAAFRAGEDGGVSPVPLRAAPVRIVGGSIRDPSVVELNVTGPDRWLLNPGAVGQPRDGDPRAAVALVDREHGRVLFARLPYDVAGAQAEIRARGLPLALARRLAVGR